MTWARLSRVLRESGIHRSHPEETLNLFVRIIGASATHQQEEAQP
jgi:hypothetical protein